ncbi:MAG: ATP-binding protein, partial [Zavarzinia sp.]|nr:ATP-binding protein [Zavarzinia sp.]
MTETSLLPLLARIADSLDRLAPPAARDDDPCGYEAYVWQTDPMHLHGVAHVARVPIDLLQGIALVRDTLVDNTRRFAAGLPANNALLWGARGMGKSSLVKAAHAAVLADHPGRVALVEISREDLHSLPELLRRLRGVDRRFILFCDDLSFDQQDASYKSLKAVLDGGIEGRPPNVIFYATSNRRHLLSRDMIENERSTAINPGEAVEEKVSLSDRF